MIAPAFGTFNPFGPRTTFISGRAPHPAVSLNYISNFAVFSDGFFCI